MYVFLNGGSKKDKRLARCPICKKNEADTATRPFCSRRCADVDLQRWLTGAYVIPGAPDELDSEDNAPE